MNHHRFSYRLKLLASLRNLMQLFSGVLVTMSALISTEEIKDYRFGDDQTVYVPERVPLLI